MRKAILFLVIIAITANLSAQKTKTVTASGEAFGSCIEQVKEDALNNAKRSALIEAGVQERISSLASIIISSGTSQAMQVENELSMLELDSRLTLKDDPGYEMDIVNGMVHVKATVRAKVMVDEEKNDPTFGLKLEGMDAVYRDGENMEFTITPYGSDCYVRIFWFDGMPSDHHPGAVLYPDPSGRYFVDAVFEAGKPYSFPKLPEKTHCNPERINPARLPMGIQKEGETSETCIVWVVALKKQVPFDVDCTYEAFLKWLRRIPANERVVRYQPVTTLANTK